MRRNLALCAALMALSGCSYFKPGAAYIAADRQTFNAVQPFLENEKAVQPQYAPDIADLQKSWADRLIQAEGKP